MKLRKISFKIASMVMVLTMMFSICATTISAVATPAGEGKSAGSESAKNKITYVSIGDSMTNGYGIDGYDGESGIVNYAMDTYSNKFAAWLAGYNGVVADDQVIFEGTNAIVDHRQLAMSGLRAEDLNWILNLDYENSELMEEIFNKWGASWQNEVVDLWYGDWGFTTGDYRTWSDFCDWDYRYADGAAKILATYHGNAANSSYYQSGYATDDAVQKAVAGLNANKRYPAGKTQVNEIGGYKYLQISTEFFQESVKDADVISLALGNTNFGTYMLNEIMEVVMYNNLTRFPSRFDIENVFTLADMDPQLESNVRKLIDESDVLINQYFEGLAGGDEEKMECIRNIIVYCIVSYIVNYIDSVETILTLNENAHVDIIQVALMNAYAVEDDEIDGTTLGDVVGILYTPINGFIAALPTYMKLSGNDLYDKATFYYAEAEAVSCMVDVYGGDFYKNAEGEYVEYNGFLDGTEGYTANLNSTVRDRFIDNIVKGETFALINSFSAVDTSITIEEIANYDMMTPSEKAAYAATNVTKAKSIAIYLAFEKATIEAGRGTVTIESLAALGVDLYTVFYGVIGSLQTNATQYGKDNYLDAAAAVVAARINAKLGSNAMTADYVKAIYQSADRTATAKYMIAGLVKAGVAADSSAQPIINGYHGGDVDATLACTNTAHPYCSAVLNAYNTTLNTKAAALVEAVANVDSLCYLLGVPEILSTSMTNDSTLSGILCMNSRCLIGTGIGGHPSQEGHKVLFDSVVKAYSEEYTSINKTAEDVIEVAKILAELVAEYYNEAYEYTYAELKAAGYIEAAKESLEDLVVVLGDLAVELDDTKVDPQYEDLKAHLVDEIYNTIDTIDALNELLDTEALDEVEAEKLDNLLNSLINHGETLVLIAIELVNNALSSNFTPTKDTNYVAINGGSAVYAKKLAQYISKNVGKAIIPNYMTWDALDYDKLAEADLITIGYDENEISGFAVEQLLAYVAEHADEDILNNEYVDLAGREVAEMDWAQFVGADHVHYVEEALELVREEILANGDFSNEEILGVPAIDVVMFAVESYLYSYVSFQAEYAELLVDLYEINPDATIILLGQYNPFDVEFTVGDYTLDLGKAYGYIALVSNVPSYLYALVSPKVGYVDISDAPTKYDEMLANGETDGTLLDFALIYLVDSTITDISSAGQDYIFECIKEMLIVGCDHRYDYDCSTICKKCGEVRDLDEHVYKNSCDEYCNICGEKREGAGHQFDSYKCDSKCVVCGEVSGAHRFANCEDAVCIYCGVDVGTKKHFFDGCFDEYCRNCDYVREAPGHTFDDCLDTKCNGDNCDFSRPMQMHTYSYDCDMICNNCGFERDEFYGHYYNGCEDTKCKYCGYPLEPGKHVYDNCADYTCNNSMCGQTRQPLAHQFSAWKVSVAPTQTVCGAEKRTCSVCKVTEVREIAALGDNGAIVFIVIGAVLVLDLAAFAIYWFAIQKKTLNQLLAVFGKKTAPVASEGDAVEAPEAETSSKKK